MHPFLTHLANVSAAEPHDLWHDGDASLPALYLSHGAPPTFEDPVWMAELFDWARSLPRPKAILIVSAHWETAPLMLSNTAANADLVYDFGGFAQMYYDMRYDTPDSSGLAAKVKAMVGGTEDVYEHQSRGLDHGAWVPLKIMYPEGDIPVLQMSMPTHDPERLLRLGATLKELREIGVLIIGSGFMTHGLQFIDWNHLDRIPSWSKDFDDWAKDALDRGGVDDLANYRALAPGLPYAHPTVEHYVPLFVTLGAAQSPDTISEAKIEGFPMGLSKRSFQIN
jgi:4,5-DOPA dioxygenase extradiol